MGGTQDRPVKKAITSRDNEFLPANARKGAISSRSHADTHSSHSRLPPTSQQGLPR